ncbi:hypothetical protein KBC75_02085 [Candidatus Shapirobacteria bacterium]|nr:hypothetical protein [Candidatus Shapirobacteria bacterium]
MIRTQIYLDDNLLTNLRIGAKLNKTTVSGYLRDLLREKIKTNSQVKSKNAFSELIKIANSFPKTKKKTNLSENIDKYLPENLR